jgi:hypothetical protein
MVKRVEGGTSERWCSRGSEVGVTLGRKRQSCVTGAIAFYDSLVAMAPYFPPKKVPTFTLHFVCGYVTFGSFGMRAAAAGGTWRQTFACGPITS